MLVQERFVVTGSFYKSCVNMSERERTTFDTALARIFHEAADKNEDYKDDMIAEKIIDADDNDGGDVIRMRKTCMQETRKRKKVLKPVPKAVLLKSVSKDEIKQRDAERHSRLEALLNELEEQEPKERKTLCLMIQIGIDDIVDIGVDGEIDTIEDLKQKLEDRCKFAIATLYVKITGQWARLCPCDVIKNVIRLDDDLMAVPCESCYRVQTYFVRGLILKL